MNLIGLGGWKEHGKDALAEFINDISESGQLVGMSEPLCEAALRTDPWIQLPDKTYWFEKLSDIVAHVGWTEAKTIPDVRTFLQGLGTDVGRKMWDENVWVNIARTRVGELLGAGRTVAVTGIRYPNELKMINDFGGMAVWVERPGHVTDESTADHESEHALTSVDFDQVILNDGTLDDLRTQAVGLVARMAGA